MNRVQRSRALGSGATNRDSIFAAGCAFMAQGDLPRAEAMFRRALAMRKDFGAFHNLGEVLRRAGRPDDAAAALQEAVALAPDDHRSHNSLVGTYLELLEYDRAKQHGLRTLELKDNEGTQVFASVAAVVPPAPLPVLAGGAGSRSKRVISFSLFGADPFYQTGAVVNVAAAAEHFPGWVCRFYCSEDIPADVVARLRHDGAEVIIRPPASEFFGELFWRFDAADDPEVDAFLCRDCDSRLCRKDALAVNAWLESGADFHVMRDHVLHCEVMLAGMWGGRGGLLPAMQTLERMWRERFFEAVNVRVQDQMMLRHMVWPLIRDRAVVHDSVYRFRGSRPFPSAGTVWDSQQLGMRM